MAEKNLRKDAEELLDLVGRFKEDKADFYRYYRDLSDNIIKTRKHLEKGKLNPQDQFLGVFQA